MIIPLILAVANQTDHNRIRKLLAHAFSDSALLEQEPLLTYYFDLLVSKFKQQIDGPAHGRVDMMAYYNFVTFDIIAYDLNFFCCAAARSDFFAETLSSASLLELSRAANIIHGLGYSPSYLLSF